VHVLCRRKESSRSISHLLMRFFVRFISMKVYDKVYILLVNSFLKIHSKLCTHCWNINKSWMDCFLTRPVELVLGLIRTWISLCGPRRIIGGRCLCQMLCCRLKCESYTLWANTQLKFMIGCIGLSFLWVLIIYENHWFPVSVPRSN